MHGLATPYWVGEWQPPARILKTSLLPAPEVSQQGSGPSPPTEPSTGVLVKLQRPISIVLRNLLPVMETSPLLNTVPCLAMYFIPAWSENILLGFQGVATIKHDTK